MQGKLFSRRIRIPCGQLVLMADNFSLGLKLITNNLITLEYNMHQNQRKDSEEDRRFRDFTFPAIKDRQFRGSPLPENVTLQLNSD